MCFFPTVLFGRCLQLPKPETISSLSSPTSPTGTSTTIDDSAFWRDFLARVKESIVSSFDTHFSTYEEEVRKIDSQRQLPGWNFCTFFIQKEGLAHSFEAMNLLTDALVQYDELEASYSLGGMTGMMGGSNSIPWFSRLGGTEQGDESLSILDSTKKEYRNLIVGNDISIFDFRIYLFSRQVALLTRMGRTEEVARRARPFIYSMGKLLRSHVASTIHYSLHPYYSHLTDYPLARRYIGGNCECIPFFTGPTPTQLHRTVHLFRLFRRSLSLSSNGSKTQSKPIRHT